jgi:hypothetical protein
MRCCNERSGVAAWMFLCLQPVPLADIEQMSLVTVTREDELSRCVRIHLPTSDEKVTKISFYIYVFSDV